MPIVHKVSPALNKRVDKHYKGYKQLKKFFCMADQQKNKGSFTA
jgi:hypothetical protein